MRALRTRVEKLEEAVRPDKLPLEGWKTVDLSETIARARQQMDFGEYGFSIELIDPPPPLPIPRRSEGKLDFKKALEDGNRRRAFMERLRSLPRAGREKLAKRHGYRVVCMPANGRYWGPENGKR